MKTKPIIQHSYYCANILCHFYHTQTTPWTEAGGQQNHPGLILQYLILYMCHCCGFFQKKNLQQQSKEVRLSWAMATFVIVYFKELEHQMGGIYFSESAKYIVNNSTHFLLWWEDPQMCNLKVLKVFSSTTRPTSGQYVGILKWRAPRQLI